MNCWYKKCRSLAFTQYEARAYGALVGLGTATAYAVSKAAGIPRARIYDTLASLHGRGLAMAEEDGEGAKTYHALPVKCFLDQAKASWNGVEKGAMDGGILKRLQWLLPRRHD